MFSSRARQQKSDKLIAVIRTTKPADTVNQPSAFRSTISSMAKRTTPNFITANKGAFRTSTNTSSSTRSVTKSQIISNTERKTTTNVSAKIALANTNANVTVVKSTRNANSTDTMGGKSVKQDSKLDKGSRLAVVKATVAKKPQPQQSQLGPAHRTRAASTCRTLQNNAAAVTSTDGSRPWKRNHTCCTLMRSKNPYEDYSESQDNKRQFLEFGVQTNEKEIINHSLLVGDIKFLNPSQHIVNEIEKQRKELKTQQLLKTTRKFEEHSERQEEHLNDLKEFLEKSYVTKRPRKARESLEEEQKLLNSMDQLLNREIPKTESITDIKARIKRKEQELLKLFDNVQTTAGLMSKSN